MDFVASKLFATEKLYIERRKKEKGLCLSTS